MLRDSAGAGAPQASSSSSSSATSPTPSPSFSSLSTSSRFAAATAAGVASTDTAFAASSKAKSQTQSTLADSLRALRGNSSRESLLGATSASGGRRKAAPSPLHHSSSHQNTSAYSSGASTPRSSVSPLHSPLASPRLTDGRPFSPQNADAIGHQNQNSSIREPSTRDRSTSGPAVPTPYAYPPAERKVSAPAMSTAQLSPPQTPTAMAPPAAGPRPDQRPTAVRNVSMDSATSSISSEPQSRRSTPSNPHRAPQEGAPTPSAARASSGKDKPEHKDLGSYITSVGSPQAALEALWKEKQTSSQHTAQLWRLVEKQREMILGLNRDLERTGKDKERYRKKLKEHLAQKPALPHNMPRNDSALSRGHTPSPVRSERDDTAGRESAASEHRDATLLRTDSGLSAATAASESPVDSKPSQSALLPVSDPSRRDVRQTATFDSAKLVEVRRRDTVDRAPQAASPTALATAKPGQNSPQYPLTPNPNPSPHHIKPHGGSNAPTVSLTQPTPIMGHNAFASPVQVESPTLGVHKQTASIDSTTSTKTFGNAAASPTSTRKKAPPAPLDLSKPNATSAHLHQQQPGERSDTDYEDVLEDGEDVPPILRERGRRKTREEDDALREALAKSEERSKSTKKKSKSKSKPGSEALPPQAVPQLVEPHSQQAGVPAAAPPVPGLGFMGLPASPRLPPPEAAGSINALLSPTHSDSSGGGVVRGGAQTFQGTPPLKSPGLPLSPRPLQANSGQAPVGLPMSPRAGKTTFGAQPLSPRPGVGTSMASAMPLSPRAPRSAIPLPPTSPLGASNPHLQRAEQHAHGPDSLAARMVAPMAHVGGSDHGKVFGTRDDTSAPPEGIYHGLEDDRYPGLLLPPNALPSIDAKVYSSRMRPSRNSILFAKPDDDPVFQLGIYARSSGRQLWRVEKTTSALAQLHRVAVSHTDFTGALPDKSLFDGHAPAKIDARREALNTYFDALLDTEMDERTALDVCSFFSDGAIEPEQEDAPAPASARGGRSAVAQLQQQEQQQQRQQQQHHQPVSSVAPAAPGASGRQPGQKYRKEGYLTKRGKNFGGWKARFFVLDGSALTYYDTPGGQEIGRIKLTNAQIGKQQTSTSTPNSRSPSVGDGGSSSNAEDNEYRHAFLVLEPKRKDARALVRHVLCAESDAERDAWVAALLLHVEPQHDDASHIGGLEPPSQSRSQYQQSQVPHLDRTTSTGNSGRNVTNGERSLLQSRGHTYHTPPPPASRGHDSTSTSSPEIERPELVQGYSYDNMPQQQEPHRGPDRSGLPSPSLEGAFPANDHNKHGTSGKPISGPSGAMKIQDASLWGNKTPSSKEHKKRSIFGFRGRASSDLAPGEKPNVIGASRSLPHPGAGHAVFGVPLAEAVDFTKPFESEEPLPSVVYRCIEYLRENEAVGEEGIFRLSGSNVTIRALKERFNTEGDVRLLEGEYYDINAVASLLKAYLRELPVSVLTRELHLDFLNVLKHDDIDKVKAFNVLIHRLPPENRALVSTLAQFLIEIVDNQDRNKMNIRNIAIVFGPTLNIPGPIITAFLTDYDAIFSEIVEEEQASPIRETLVQASQPGSEWDGIRSPRHQMFSDLPTPAYHQSGFQNLGGFAPLQQGGPPSRPVPQPPQQSQQQQQQHQYYGQQQHRGISSFSPPDHQHPHQQQQQQYMTQAQPSHDGYGSLNAALGPAPPQQPQQQQRLQVDDRQLRKAKRESNMHMLGNAMQGGAGAGGGGRAEPLQQQRKSSHQNLREGSREGQQASPARQY